jgi:hypothetical protein
MKAKLIKPSPKKDRNWCLEFTDFSTDENEIESQKVNIKCAVYDYAKEQYNLNPFYQGEDDSWLLIEFWSSNIESILNASIAICNELKLSLEY